MGVSLGVFVGVYVGVFVGVSVGVSVIVSVSVSVCAFLGVSCVYHTPHFPDILSSVYIQFIYKLQSFTTD